MSGGKGSSPSGTTTSTQNTQPWSAQIPYLEQAMGSAQGLYSGTPPQYYPGTTYAGENWLQNLGLQDAWNPAIQQSQSGVIPAAGQSETNLLSGNYLGTAPGMSTLEKYAFGTAAPTADLQVYAAGTAPGLAPLQSFASGSQTNPYINDLSQSVMSSVVPQIESQFINGGGLSSPEAAYSTASGATTALAPTLANAFQQEQQNQLAAATNAAGIQTNAAAQAGGLETGAANNAGSLYNQNLTQMIQGLALEPQTLSAAYTPSNELLAAGNAQQALDQGNINDQVQRYNYGETLPYQTLNEYLSQIGGNYGGTTTSTQPFFENSTANALGGALGGATLGNMLFPAAAGGTAFGALGGGGLGLLAAFL